MRSNGDYGSKAGASTINARIQWLIDLARQSLWCDWCIYSLCFNATQQCSSLFSILKSASLLLSHMGLALEDGGLLYQDDDPSDEATNKLTIVGALAN